MAKFDKAGVSLELDTSDFDRDYKKVLADAGQIDSLAPTVKINVNDSEIGTALDLAANLDASTSLKVNVDSAELTDAKDKLDDIANISAIDLAINIAGTASTFFEGLGRFSGVAGLLEMDTALAAIEGRTGRMIPGAEKLITDLYTNGWGESRTQIADTIIEAGKLQIANEDLAEATEAAFHVQAVTGGETNEILRTMDSLVKNDLVPSYTAAADLITVGFQTGSDRGQDALDTLNEYASTFKQVGISGEGALGFINSGLSAGIDNSDRIADAIRETGIRLGEIGTDENIAAAFEQLDALSDIDLAKSLDAKNAGEISGDEFYAGFFEALADANEVDPQAAQSIAATLVGTIAEDFGIESVSQLTPIWDETMGSFEDRAETAGNTISDTLGVTVDTFLRNIEQMATSFLESDAIDLDGKIEAFKTQLQTALSTIADGGSLGDALEIGFGIPGVDVALGNIERVFGQMYLSLLEVVAFIQDPTGQTDNDSLTRARLATGAAAQLPFDLLLANSEEVEGLLKQAVARGVTDLFPGLTTALDEALAAGDYDQVVEILQGIVKTAEIPRETAEAFVNSYTSRINDALNAAEPIDIIGPNPAPADPMANVPGILKNDSSNPFNNLSTIFQTGSDAATTAMTEMNTAAETSGGVADTMLDSVTSAFEGVATSATTNMDTAAGALNTLDLAGIQLDTNLANYLTGNTVTASFDAMSASAVANADITKAAFTGILATVANVDQRMSAFFHGVMAKVGIANDAIANIGVVPPGGGSSTTNNVYNVSQTNNVQSNAQAAASGYELGAQIRGMA